MGSLPQLSIIKGPQCDVEFQFPHKIFEGNVEKLGDGKETAIIHDIYDQSSELSAVTTTYQELNSQSNQYARTFLNLIQKQWQKSPNMDGDWIITVCMSPSANLIKNLLAIWKTGAAYLPIDPNFPQSRIDHILQESKPVLIVHDDEIDAGKFGSNSKTISWSELLKLSEKNSTQNLPLNQTLTCGQSKLGIVLYTSGSTGIPKGVRINFLSILNRLNWQWKQFPYSATEKIGIFKTALTFVDSVSELWGPLLNNMAIIVIPKEITKDPEHLVTVLDKYKIERIILVPTLLRSILMYLTLRQERNLLRSLTKWICSGETLSVPLATEFFDHFQDDQHILCNFYGSTEIMGDVTFFVCKSRSQIQSFSKIPIGYPLDNTIIFILDEDFRPVKIGEKGELFVAGLNLAFGYVNGRDSNKFIENPLAIDPKYGRLYRTGDFASITKGDIIQYEGRTDSQIKIRGHRVDLTEIERNVLKVDGIDKVVVMCYHIGDVDQSILAFVTLKESAKLCDEIQLENRLKEHLVYYMLPQIIIKESIPLLVNGKVDRQALLKAYETANNNDDDTEIVIDYNYDDVPEYLLDVTKILFETIGSVIGRSTRKTLCLDSNFYELGGNSLNSIFTVTKLRQQGFNIGISQFINAKNLRDVIQQLKKLESNEKNLDYDNMLENVSFVAEPLALHHKNAVIEIITTSFFEKADLEQWLKPKIHFTDYGDILDDIWEILVEKGLSFVVKNKYTDDVCGVALNFDAHDEPEICVNSQLIIVFEFLEYLEGSIRDTQLPTGLNKIFHSFMMGTSSTLNAQENISIMHFMENEVLTSAKRKKFVGILTTNTNPLTQQLGNIYNYQAMLDYQVNQFVYGTDNSRPFGMAPAAQRAIVHWKDIS